MRVAFVLRSAEVQPRFQDLCGNGLVYTGVLLLPILPPQYCIYIYTIKSSFLINFAYLHLITPFSWRKKQASKVSKTASFGAVLRYKI
jgi:hypothetical protein